MSMGVRDDKIPLQRLDNRIQEGIHVMLYENLLLSLRNGLHDGSISAFTLVENKHTAHLDYSNIWSINYFNGRLLCAIKLK